MEDEEDQPTYRIVRKFFNHTSPEREIATGLTLAEAKEHCADPETSSKTATNPEPGVWMDVFYEE